MTEPNKIQTIDGELPRHCAFTLPGVVLALGSDNWHILNNTYEILSTDMQVSGVYIVLATVCTEEIQNSLEENLEQ